ncbi:hypothetical protein Tco_0593575 [Tanacetum coccineum]
MGLVWSTKRVASIKGEEIILVNVDDYSRYLGLFSYDPRMKHQKLLKMGKIWINERKKDPWCHGWDIPFIRRIDLAHNDKDVLLKMSSQSSVPQGQKESDYDNSDPLPPRQNVVPTAKKTDSSQQGLEFLFSPLIEEYYNPTHGQAEENNNETSTECILSRR